MNAMTKNPTYEDLEQRIRALEKGQDASKGIDSTPKNPEAVYRIMLESISDTIIVTDDQGNMLYVCTNTAIIFGFSQDEVLSLNTIQKLLDGSICDISDLKEHGEFQNIEWTIKDANGQTRFLLINVKSVNINGGTVLYVMRDITDRKQDEEDLKRYRNIVSSTPDGISLLDKNYRYVIVNDAYEKSSGVDRENIIGVTVSEYLGKEAFEKYIQPNFEKCLQGETINYQGWFEYPALGKRFADITYYPYRDSGNKIIGVVANTRDITSQRLAEEALQESEGRFRTLFMSMSEGFYISEVIHDDEGNPCDYRHLEVNPKFEQIIGLSREQIIGKRYKELVPVDTTQWMNTYCKVARTGIPQKYYFYSPEYRMHFETFAYKSAANQVTVFVVDITEHKLAEEKLKQEATWRRILIDQSRDGIVVLDQNGKVYEANQRYAKMLGYSMEEVHQLHVWDWDAQ
jgi:PAS domain S-box-containing protein